MSVQAAVLQIIDDFRRDSGTSVVFVTHELSLVRALCDRLIVLQDGRVCEEGETAATLDAPATTYTRDLLAAVVSPID